MLQKFKTNDVVEQKVIDALDPELVLIGDELDAFFENAFTAAPLGDVIYDLKAAPMTNAVSRDTFRNGFWAIFNLFTRPSTFEFYLEVFRAIWGDDVEVEFIIPSEGILWINITALGVGLQKWEARRLVDNQYVYEEVVTHDGDNICFQGVKGIQTQSETDALIYELHAAGVQVHANLILP